MEPALPVPRPSLDRCSACGQPTEASERCPHCGASLLVDVALDPPPADAREAYGAARAAASAGIPGLDFAAARAALALPGATLARALRRERARALVNALAGGGYGVVARAAAGPPARRGLPATAWIAAAAAAAFALAGGAALLLRGRGERPAPPAPEQAAVAPAPAAGPSPAVERAPAATAGERDLTVEELARVARPAIAQLRCGGKLGSGFFVAPERLVTNAHVTCGPNATLEVRLPTGRQLLGKVRAQDDWLDFAVVDVPGAKIAEPLPLGDSTALVEGNPVVLVGNPLGLDATVHAGKVSFAARGLQGVAHVQLNADVNPGNSGGPVLDGKGRVVGIVTLKLDGASGVGFALPIEYVRPAAELPQQEARAAQRWAATLEAMKQRDDDEAARVLARLDEAMLVEATAVQGRLGVGVLKRFTGRPYGATFPIEVRDGDRVVCELTATFQEWRPIEEKLKEAIEGERATRVARWMMRRGITAGVYVGGALLGVDACPATVGPSAIVQVRGIRDEVVAYPAQDLARGRKEAQERAGVGARVDAASDAQRESDWRAAFAQLRSELARLQDKRRALQETIDRSGSNVDANRLDVAMLDRQIARARERLDDLERRAANEAVPLEWRR